MLFRTLPSKSAVIMGTGPSLNDRAVEWAYYKAIVYEWALFGVNQCLPEGAAP